MPFVVVEDEKREYFLFVNLEEGLHHKSISQ
jgi:hypothetical protein